MKSEVSLTLATTPALKPAPLLCALFCLLLAACGGGANEATAGPAGIDKVLPAVVSPAPSGVSEKASTQPVPVQLNYLLPLTRATSSLWTNRSVQGTCKLAASSSYTGYTSTAAAITISLHVTPLGGATSNSTGTCTAAASGTSGTCVVSFTAAPGPTTLAGSLSESGQVIASFSQVAIIAPNTANSLNFTANPVVSSVALQLASPTITAGAPGNVALVINAQDANGNTIAGTAPYVDINGQPVAFTLSVTQNQAGGHGNASIQGPVRITSPSQGPVAVHYDGGWLASGTVVATSSSSAIAPSSGVVLNTTPKVFEYPIPTSNAVAYAIVKGPDGNVWFNENNPLQVARITPSGSIHEYLVRNVAASFLDQINVGPDGNIWMTDYDNNDLARVTLSGSVQEVSSGILNPVACATGSNGNMWCFGVHHTIYQFQVHNGSLIPQSNHLIAGGSPGGFFMTAGPNGNMWFTMSTSDVVGEVDPTNTTVQQFTTPTTSSSPTQIAVGADGNLWFAESNTNKIGRSTPGGSVVEFPLTLSSAPWGMTEGPDGNVWFTDDGTNSVGYMTPSGSYNEYPVPTAASNLNDITLGADGNIWFVETDANNIGKLVL